VTNKETVEIITATVKECFELFKPHLEDVVRSRTDEVLSSAAFWNARIPGRD
jgi:hypothetical protein